MLVLEWLIGSDDHISFSPMSYALLPVQLKFMGFLQPLRTSFLAICVFTPSANAFSAPFRINAQSFLLSASKSKTFFIVFMHSLTFVSRIKLFVQNELSLWTWKAASDSSASDIALKWTRTTRFHDLLGQSKRIYIRVALLKKATLPWYFED